MKRLSLIAITILAAAGFTALFSGGSVYANQATPDGGGGSKALICYQDWNGETPKQGSNKEKNYKESGCDKSNDGNCKTDTIKRDGEKYTKITCNKPAGSTSGSTSIDGYTDEAATSEACTEDGCDIIDKFINPFIRVLSVLVGIAAAMGIIIGAIQVSTSAGDPQKAANGKNHIRNAIIAIVTYVLLFVVLNWLIPGGIV